MKVLYHDNCPDGFCAATIVKMYYERSGEPFEFIGVQYGKDLPEIRNEHVLILDFCPENRGDHKRLLDENESVTIIDHHKTAQLFEDRSRYGPRTQLDVSNERPGAMMTWDTFYPGVEAPMIVRYVQDRDLWKWELPKSREVSAAIQSYPMTFEVWEQWFRIDFMERFMAEGEGIIRYQKSLIERIVAKAGVQEISIRTEDLLKVWTVPWVNSPVLQSEIGEALAKDGPFAGVYFIDAEGNMIVSLRSSVSNGEDVSVVAKAMGGGGHRNAAGFKIDSVLMNKVLSQGN